MHILTHIGDVPYKCDICTKQFIDAGSLKKHTVTDKDENSQKSDNARRHLIRM